jgi:protein Tex
MSNKKNITTISKELDISERQIISVITLLEDDATIPFIARYRKEVTGGLDEVQLISIRDRFERLTELDKRREAIIKSLTEQEKLTPELEKALREAATMARLEDIYLPYKPKRRTRGTIAKEKGLETLAEIFFNQKDDFETVIGNYIDTAKGVATREEAIAGAKDIIAEWVNEDSEAREQVRRIFSTSAAVRSVLVKGKDEEGQKYKDYFNWQEDAAKAPSHRILALLRGAEEGILNIHFLPEEEEVIDTLHRKYLKGSGPSSSIVKDAVDDSYKRLMSPSMETELRNNLKARADEEAIRVFSENIRELLLSPPMGQKATLAVDPGLRTGCKVVCLSPQGALLYNTAIYPLEPHNKKEESAKVIRDLQKKYNIEAIAVGNGTGGREALDFVKSLGLGNCIITMVNESGASIYSASETARREFPTEDVTVRGSVSIGRRLMDPLAELVKIDPQSIGVGQYQHDVDQKNLKRSLDDTVISCVNSVGVEINTASGELLQYVSGLSPRMANAIVSHRNDNGPFEERNEILQVPGMGPRSYEQSAGFLRIRDGRNPLDYSAVHPESYHIIEQMARDLDCSVKDLLQQEELRSMIDLKKYVSESVGMETLKDIYNELAKPGRDPRKEFELFTFKDGVNEIKDLQGGMVLPGVVTNVTAFGAFVDIGVHQDGLVHISQLADDFIRDPNEVVKVNQKVSVRVLEVDIARKRISLSMKHDEGSSRGVKKVDKKKTDEKKSKKKVQGNAARERKKEDHPGKPVSPFAGLKDLIK